MQPTLFDFMEEPQVERSLIIIRKQKQPSNKQQQSFNKLINKIEKLRVEIETTTVRLDKQLKYYVRHIHPLEQEIVTLRKEVMKLLYPFLTKRKCLVKSQKYILKELLSRQLQEILSMNNGPLDDDLKKIFETVNGISLEKMNELDIELMKEELGTMADSFGVDMDFDDFKKDMTAAEILSKMKKLEEEYNRQIEENHKRYSKKSAKQLQKENKEKQLEEARNKSISSIYKQLAKALHPDLEQDEHRKAEKEELMKSLTYAYNNKDLHTLLTLEINWLHKEEDFQKMNIEKLSLYNKVLKEQIQDLTLQLNTLDQHPRFFPLQRYSLFSNEINLEWEKIKTVQTLDSIKASICNLKGENATEEVKEIIQILEPEYSEQKFNIDLTDFDDISFSYRNPKSRSAGR